MKRNKLFRFISVLLCLTLIFAVGCSSSAKLTELPDETGNKVGGSISEYVNMQFESKFADNVYVEEIKGVYEGGRDYGLIVTVNEDKDLMNNIVETYSVFNVELNKQVLTVENKSEDFMSTTDKFGNYYHKSSEMSVRIKGDYGISLIVVETVTYTKIDDALIEDYEDHDYEGIDGEDRYQGTGYEASYKYDYYDACGTLIVSTDMDVDYELASRTAVYEQLNFGKTAALFDRVENKLIETWDITEDNKRAVYDVKNELYCYLLNASFGAYGALEVYSLEDSKLVYRYPYASALSGGGTKVLSNGDVLIQDYTMLMLGVNDPSLSDPSAIDMEINVDTFLLHTDRAELEAVETDYMFTSVATGAELVKMGSIAYTDKVLNVGVVVEKPKDLDSFNAEEKVVFFNSDLEITCEVATLHPEQIAVSDFDDLGLGIETLATGDLLVTIKTAVDYTNSQAIITSDGELRCYVPMGATVLERVIVMDSGIYNFDLEYIMGFGDEDNYFAYTIGNSIVVARNVLYGENQHRTEYFVIDEDYYMNSYNEEFSTIGSTFSFVERMLNYEYLPDGFYFAGYRDADTNELLNAGLYYHNGSKLIDCEEVISMRQYGDNYIVAARQADGETRNFVIVVSGNN